MPQRKTCSSVTLPSSPSFPPRKYVIEERSCLSCRHMWRLKSVLVMFQFKRCNRATQECWGSRKGPPLCTCNVSVSTWWDGESHLSEHDTWCSRQVGFTTFCLQHSSEYLPLCSAEQRHSYRFGTTWGWVNDRIFIFGWTIPLRMSKSVFSKWTSQ